ncbi:hypothetical protein PHIN8_05800 [Polynucleobacter sp. HIN8]|jgi:hypothetical protein|nr:hypothetical protein PHIN8_05800 [Polynucleobacter sp. HIN8]
MVFRLKTLVRVSIFISWDKNNIFFELRVKKKFKSKTIVHIIKELINTNKALEKLVKD